MFFAKLSVFSFVSIRTKIRAFYDEYIGFTYAMNVLGHGLICYFFFSIWKNTK